MSVESLTVQVQSIKVNRAEWQQWLTKLDEIFVPFQLQTILSPNEVSIKTAPPSSCRKIQLQISLCFFL